MPAIPPHYSLHIPINSATYIPTSGIFYLRLKVIDSANLQSIQYINLNVDNVFPSGTWDSINANPTAPVHAGLAKFLKEHKAWNDKWKIAGK